MLEQIGPEISAPVWTGKKLAGLAGDPIGHETHPFARSRIDEGQPFGKMVGKLQEIAAPARSPVDRIRIHFKSDLAKDADRAEYPVRQVISTGIAKRLISATISSSFVSSLCSMSIASFRM